ncbi:MAG TPA: DUF4846 domain-containing protein [Chitinophagaceae bacterium]|nr:DUF4846 domain-containing protein [Chitinophagaceae bacterium]
MRITPTVTGLWLLCGCAWTETSDPCKESLEVKPVIKPSTIGEIELPPGFTRIPAEARSFAGWLRKITLKNDKTIYLYNGKRKSDQSAQFAVLDIPIGNKNLQQCADAVMRLRAEYLFSEKRFEEIVFRDNGPGIYRWEGGDDRRRFEPWLEKVFGWCGTASLEKQLKSLSNPLQLIPGDVLIEGGFPGHAMIEVDMAADSTGKKIFLLAQGYMPAQDIHIVKNLLDADRSPWYELNASGLIITPSWEFETRRLKRW